MPAKFDPRAAGAPVAVAAAVGAYVGLLVSLELAGPNYMWESARDLVLLVAWSVVLFGVAAGVLGLLVTAAALAARRGPERATSWVVVATVAALFFIDRFGACYPCHQFLDKQAPHLVFTPAKSLALTVALAAGSLAVGLAAGLAAGLLRRNGHRRAVRALLVSALALGAALATVLSYRATPSRGRPVTLIAEPQARAGGVDRLFVIADEGLDWAMVDEIMAEGRAPVLKGLAESGVRGSLATLYPTLSHPLLATVATGQMPARHGIGSKISYAYPGMARGVSLFPCPTRMMLPDVFIRLAAAGFGGGRPLGPAQRRAKALWNIASDCSVSVGVIGWRSTWPAERVQGFMISDRLEDDDPAGDVFPSDLAPEVAAILAGMPEPDPAKLVGRPVDDLRSDPLAARKLGMLTGNLRNDLRSEACAESLFSNRRPTLAMLGFFGMDGIQHRFYPEHSLTRFPEEYKMGSYLSEVTSAHLIEAFADVVENAYAFRDSLAGVWRSWLGENDALIILSEHGWNLDGSNHHYAAPGVLLMVGRPFKRGFAIEGATILDIAPTVLYLLGLPVPRDMEGTILRPAFDPAWLDANPIRTIPTYGVP
ncbi:MAG: alkaline phosphatase family protein [bacterium]